MGGEEETTAVSLPPSSLLPPKNPSTLSSIRFFGLLKQPPSDPDSDPNPFDLELELDESDVIWPSDLSYPAVDRPAGPAVLSSPDSSAAAGRIYSACGFGLSAALADDPRPIRSVATAARIVPAAAVRSEAVARSAPVNVPTWHGRARAPRFDDVEDGEEGEEVEDDGEEMVPPHVIVARSHVTTFSVFEGVGRTLKGRDLRRVRNAVFQKTGFLD